MSEIGEEIKSYTFPVISHISHGGQVQHREYGQQYCNSVWQWMATTLNPGEH